MKFKFWREQPVFHIYDISYYFSSNQIIMNELPSKNKYCNFQNIVTGASLSPLEITHFVRFIGQHYLQNGFNRYAPEAENILPYFLITSNDSGNNFFSIYREPELLQDTGTNTLVNSSKIISVMTSRLVTVEYTGANATLIKAFYVDYLCVDKAYRKKGIAPQMIQTHEYNQRHGRHDKNKNNTPISLFKREGDLTGIVPLTVYKTVVFNMKTWLKPSPLLPFV